MGKKTYFKIVERHADTKAMHEKWNLMMLDAKSSRNAYNLLKTDQVISQLVPIIDALELLLESLHQYLHTKRMLYFPFFSLAIMN